jgi:hypothetical protein
VKREKSGACERGETDAFGDTHKERSDPMSKREKAVPPQPALSLVASTTERQEQIAQRAYELHVARGCRQGHDLDDWLDAEQEIADAA